MGVLDDIREQYPTLAFLINDPEVGPLLRDAVDPNKGFSPGRFQAKLYQTQWFKKRSTAQRQWDVMQHTDPGEYRRRVSEGAAQVRMTAAKLGISLSPSELSFITKANLRNGTAVGSEEFTLNLLHYLRAQGPKRMGEGSIKGASDQVNSMARRQFYVPLSKKEQYDWGLALALGTKDESALRSFLNTKAASMYPHLKELLANGASMEDIFSGHRAVIAQEMEISPEQVDFTKAKWKKALYQVDPQTGQPRPMTLHETQTMARQQPEWWKTSGGKEADAGMANFMLKMFGKRA